MTWQGTSALRWAEEWFCCNSVTHAWCSGGVMPMEEPARGKEERMYSTTIAQKGWFELWCISLVQIKADMVALCRVKESIGLGWNHSNWNVSEVLWGLPSGCVRVVKGCVEISPLVLCDCWGARLPSVPVHTQQLGSGTTSSFKTPDLSADWHIRYLTGTRVFTHMAAASFCFCSSKWEAVCSNPGLISGSVTLKQQLSLKAPLFCVMLVFNGCCLSEHQQNPIFQSFQVLSRFYKVWLLHRIIEWPG